MIDEKDVSARFRAAFEARPTVGAAERLRSILLTSDGVTRKSSGTMSAGLRVSLRIVAIVALVALLVGTSAAFLALHNARNNSIPATTGKVPSTDRAVVAYRQMIDRDMRSIQFGIGCSGSITRQQALASVLQVKGSIETLLQDIQSTPPPSVLVPAVTQLKAALQQFLQGLDADVAALQNPNANCLVVLGSPSPSEVNRDAATIDCWPVIPYPRSDLPSGYGCTAEPS